MAAEPSANETACHLAGDQVKGTVVAVIEAGVRDGSVRKDIGDPLMLALTLWAFTHGIIQLVMAKSADLARSGIAIPDFSNYAFKLLNDAMRQYRPA